MANVVDIFDGMQMTGSMNHVIPLMNTNSNLYTVMWCNISDTDWLDSDDVREAQYAVARFFDQAYVVTPSTLHKVVLKLSVRDIDVAAQLINHALAMMEHLILAYVDDCCHHWVCFKGIDMYRVKQAHTYLFNGQNLNGLRFRAKSRPVPKCTSTEIMGTMLLSSNSIAVMEETVWTPPELWVINISASRHEEVDNHADHAIHE
ncbi:hypothetical protein ARMGADRAFT_1039863 [Armillaria gallica]|uniref:Uncharacterized protein n=1 Tax=Armillaria gallica TaxID=47427 RepID=A0A2H3CCA8_ARMGA|nr:hypothetical protein ARMGADRAFT_1039863 [Armillaria gallica]